MKIMKVLLLVVAILTLAGTGWSDWKSCRKAYKAKQWDQAFKACHVEAVKADKGKGKRAALVRVARLYREGRGTGRDYKEALRWLHKAADRGSGLAMARIGHFYYEGWGVAEDHEEAFAWYKKSAEKGNYVGQRYYGFQLVRSAVRGSGTQDDLVTGYMYIILSRDQNKGSVRFREGAAYWMGQAEERLTYGQIEEAKRRAREWEKVTK